MCRFALRFNRLRACSVHRIEMLKISNILFLRGRVLFRLFFRTPLLTIFFVQKLPLREEYLRKEFAKVPII